jgi:hypothetical protein
MRSLHRRGAENAEATQRKEKERGKREVFPLLLSPFFIFPSSLLLSAPPQRSLRLCGERVFYPSGAAFVSIRTGDNQLIDGLVTVV